MKNKRMIMISLVILALGASLYYFMNKNKDKFTNNNTDAKIVYFMMPNCPHCQKFNPTWELLKNRFSGVFKNIKFEKVDIDETPEVAERYNIKSFPTIVYMKNNVVVDKYAHDRNIQDMSRWIEYDLPKL
jgi:thioredoxin-like negative regulator of GroEL